MPEREDTDTGAGSQPHEGSGIARLVQRRAGLIAVDWTASCTIGADVSTDRVLTALVTALSGCGGNTRAGHVHPPAGEAIQELMGSTHDLASSAVTCLRDVIRRQVLVGLPVGEALDALQCVSTVLDELFTQVVEQHARHLESLAYADELTGLANRRAATGALRAALATATRHDRPLVVVAADVDHLKQVNDLEGHDAGDVVLQQIARAFRDGLRDGDIAFRTGGDEFLVVLPETELDQIDQLMRRVEAHDAPAFSYGAASSHEAASPTEIVRLADQRLLTNRRLSREGGLEPVVAVPRPPRRTGPIGRTTRATAVAAGIVLLGTAVAMGASPVTHYVRNAVSDDGDGHTFPRNAPTHAAITPGPPAVAEVRTKPPTWSSGAPTSATSTSDDAHPPATRTSTTRSSTAASPTHTTARPTSAQSPADATKPIVVRADSVASAQREVVVAVLGNDAPGDSTFDVHRLEIVQGPNAGRATVRSDGTIDYRAKGNAGDDTFQYSICTVDGRCGQATVSISRPHSQGAN